MNLQGLDCIRMGRQCSSRDAFVYVLGIPIIGLVLDSRYISMVLVCELCYVII